MNIQGQPPLPKESSDSTTYDKRNEERYADKQKGELRSQPNTIQGKITNIQRYHKRGLSTYLERVPIPSPRMRCRIKIPNSNPIVV